MMQTIKSTRPCQHKHNLQQEPSFDCLTLILIKEEKALPPGSIYPELRRGISSMHSSIAAPRLMKINSKVSKRAPRNDNDNDNGETSPIESLCDVRAERVVLNTETNRKGEEILKKLKRPQKKDMLTRLEKRTWHTRDNNKKNDKAQASPRSDILSHSSSFPSIYRSTSNSSDRLDQIEAKKRAEQMKSVDISYFAGEDNKKKTKRPKENPTR
jgi:hypothetical protein